MSIEKIKELVEKGWDESIAILSQWRKIGTETRELLSFEQLQGVYYLAFDLDYDIPEIRKLLVKKAETYPQFYWLWITSPFGSNEKKEAWIRLGGKD